MRVLIPSVDPDALLAEVKANMARLESCPGPHTFEPTEWMDDKRILARYHTCRTCLGRLESTKVRWYEMGLMAGRANAGS